MPSVKLGKGTIEFKNLCKQILVPFKFYSNFECILNSVESYEDSCSKKHQLNIPCSFAYKLVCVYDGFSRSTVVYSGKNAAYKFLETILEEHEYCK